GADAVAGPARQGTPKVPGARSRSRTPRDGRRRVPFDIPGHARPGTASRRGRRLTRSRASAGAGQEFAEEGAEFGGRLGAEYLRHLLLETFGRPPDVDDAT